MANNWQPIANSLLTIVQGALGNGPRVYNTIRWTNQPDQFLALFQNVNTKTLSAWFITRDRTNEIRGGTPQAKAVSLPFGQEARSHAVVIEGFLSFRGDGSSEQVFQQQIDSLLDILGADITLNAAVQYSGTPSSSIDIAMMAQVLCHHVTITFDVFVRQAVAFN